jgi:hypothetical protein
VSGNPWLRPKVLAPIAAASIAACGFVGQAVVALPDKASVTLDCAAERQKVVDLYDKHPEAVAPYLPKSQLEMQCQVNEFMKQLKPKP